MCNYFVHSLDHVVPFDDFLTRLLQVYDTPSISTSTCDKINDQNKRLVRGNRMEESKLVRLHHMLSKLRPGGKKGGLGFASVGGRTGDKRPDGLPNNGLYSMFVRQGEGGYHHKHWDDDEEAEADVKTTKQEKKKKKKKEERSVKSREGEGKSEELLKQEKKRLKKEKKAQRAAADACASVPVESEKVSRRKTRKRKLEHIETKVARVQDEKEKIVSDVDEVVPKRKSKKDKKKRHEKVAHETLIEESVTDTAISNHKQEKKHKKKKKKITHSV
ncbi:hypothetical protein PsorP6_005483 [Peronosclerospora sorghi]|uniref:Uncharacterized protein n=1 Tax=Peronosclerospora sorghi TaxID=230839 RepID=A0ACC0W4S7_9STRA|nr:hypothetical protein PsorP6_005483 [Peronosclerospora sorghi]